MPILTASGKCHSKDAVQLVVKKFRRGFLNSVNTGCVLGGQSCDRTHGIDSVHDHGLDICLNAGATTISRFRQSLILFS